MNGGEKLVKDAQDTAWIENEISKAVEKDLARRDLEIGVTRPDLTTKPTGGSTRITNRQIASTTSAPGVAVNGEWAGKTVGDFFQAIAPNNTKLRNDYSSLDPAGGGFLIPETLREEVMLASLETSVVRPRARVLPMPSSRLGVPIADSTSNASSVFGGMSASWSEEGSTLAESEASFGRVVLDAKKLASRCDVPNELLEDSGLLDAFLSPALAATIGFYEDQAFLVGTGSGEPEGVLNANALVSVAKESGQVAGTIVYENIVKMHSRLLPSSHNSAVWVAHPSCFPELATMAISVGTGGGPIWLTNGTAEAPPSILGKELVFSEQVPSVGNANDISLIDFSWYLLGDRSELRIESSIHSQFTSDQTVFRAIARLDGRAGLNSAITPANGSDALSPFVGLAARA